MPHGTIKLDPVSNPAANTAFTITGTLTITPSDAYADDGGAAHAVTVAAFTYPLSIKHPGLPSGTHNVAVSDAVSGASATVQVTVNAAATVIFIGANQSLTDKAGNVFRIDGSENAYETPKGASEVPLGNYGDLGWNAAQMAYDGTTVYIQDARDSTWHTFNGTAFSGPVTAPGNPPPASGAPPQAAAVGYNTRTYGPDVTLGVNWFINPGANLTQNADGSVTDHGGVPNHYNDHCSTAIGTTGRQSGDVVGCLFDGGGYFEWTFSWANPPTAGYQNTDGWPALWSWSGQGLNGATDQPNGQVVEVDSYEAMNTSDALEFNCAPIHWYNGGKYGALEAGIDDPGHAPPGTDVTQPHKLGVLWVPATATSQGYLKHYFDGVQVGHTYAWDKYAGGSVPNEAGDSPWSFIDVDGGRKFLFGTGTKNPMTVYAFEAWQKDASKNKGTKA